MLAFRLMIGTSCAIGALRSLVRSSSHIALTLCSTMSTFETLTFDNLALRTLPIDKEKRNYVRTVSGAVFSRVSPTPLESPEVVVVSEDAMMLLDLPASECDRKDAAEYLSGNKLLPGSETAAHCYCGHQFGYFAGQLGDGAAMCVNAFRLHLRKLDFSIAAASN